MFVGVIRKKPNIGFDSRIGNQLIVNPLICPHFPKAAEKFFYGGNQIINWSWLFTCEMSIFSLI